MSLVTLYCVVEGPIYEPYWAALEPSAREYFFPGEAQILRLPGLRRPEGMERPPQWSHVSATRYEVFLDHLDEIEGEYIFQIDADMRVVNPVGAEILCDGITTSLHPGVPPEQAKEDWPYERNPDSRAYVPYGGEGRQYHPGCFIGGKREAFLQLAEHIASEVRFDLEHGVFPAWYEESHLNKWFIDHPADLVLPREYCWWQSWSNGDLGKAREEGAVIVHLDKTDREFFDRD